MYNIINKLILFSDMYLQIKVIIQLSTFWQLVLGQLG